MRRYNKLKVATGFVALFLVSLLLLSSTAIATDHMTPSEPPHFERPGMRPQNPIMRGQFGRSHFNYTNGMILLETPELSVRITAMHEVIHFTYWNTSAPDVVYHAKFVRMFEFIDANNDSAYQANETVAHSVVSLSSFSWNFTGFENITDANNNVIGVMFGFVSTEAHVSWQPNLQVAIYCYLFYENGMINGISVNGLNELKFTIEVSNWTWASNESMLGMRFDLSWSNVTQHERMHARIGNEEAHLGTNTTGHEMPIKNETQRELKMEYEGQNQRVVGFLDYVPNIVIDGKNSTMTASYATNSNMLTVYFAYPHFNYYLIHDPIIGVTSESTGTSTGGTGVLPGNTIVTIGGTAVTDTMLLLAGVVVLIALAVFVKSRKA